MSKGLMVIQRGVQWLMLFVIMVLASFMIAQAILGAGIAHVKGDSMEPTLYDGQSLLFTRRSAIERYDIVLGDYERESGEEIVLIKRVIGIPEDDLAVIDGILYLNGLKYDEPYINEGYDLFGYETFRYQLGPNEYFLMGDNRDISLDSRNDLGLVHREDIKGVVKLDIGLKRGQ